MEVLTDTSGACLENTIDEPEKFGETRRTKMNIGEGCTTVESLEGEEDEK